MTVWPDGYRYCYPRNHCAAHAFAIAAGEPDPVRIAEAAYLEGLLTRRGVAYGALPRISTWLRLAGLRPVRFVCVRRSVAAWILAGVPRAAVPGQTLERFRREHPRGRWVVRVAGHMVPLVEGQLYGYYKPKMRLDWALEGAK